MTCPRPAPGSSASARPRRTSSSSCSTPDQPRRTRLRRSSSDHAPRSGPLTRDEVEHLSVELRPLGALALPVEGVEALSGLHFEDYLDDLGPSQDLVVRFGERLFALVHRPDAPVADRIVVLASDPLTPSALVEIVTALGLPEQAIVGVSNGHAWLAPTGT